MSIKLSYGHCCGICQLMVRRAAVLLVLVSLPMYLHATKYVMLNNGRLHVFPEDCISSLSVENGVVTFKALDGVDYSYNIADILSIDNELNKALPAMTAFWVDDKLNYQVMAVSDGTFSGETVHLEVGGIGKWLTPSFTLSDTCAVAFIDSAEQKSGESRLSFSSDRVYTVGYPGDMVLTILDDGTSSMRPYGTPYVVTVDFLTDHSTSVPRIDIDTEGGADISSKVEYLKAVISIDGKGVFPSMTDSVKVRGRGNASWSSNPAAKNSYRLKFASKKRPFGLVPGKNWVLLANKIKGSMLTNAIGMKAASLLGTVAANHIIPVDLYVNGVYKGNYNFTEKVGLSNNSVNLPNEELAVLLELDRYYDEPEGQKFRSDPQNIPVNVKSPDFAETLLPISLDMVSQRFNAFAAAVVNGEDISAHVDLDALARYLLLNELICNKEIFHPKSTYCYYENIFEDSSKLIFGPVWDLDWGCGYVGMSPYSYFTQLTNYDFFNRVYTGEQYLFFSALSKDRKLARRMFWIMDDFMREGLDELCEFCHEYYEYAAPSLSHSSTAFEDDVNYEVQAANAVVWLRSRANMIYENRWMDQFECGDVNCDGEVNIADINALIDIILDGNPDEEMLRRADVNGDGEINIADVNMLVDNIIAQ